MIIEIIRNFNHTIIIASFDDGNYDQKICR
jgi:hypothetical protein